MKLTTKQRDLCKHMAAGKVNKQIATAMGVTVSCIEKWKHALAGKLGLDGTRDLLIWAVRNEATL